MFLLFALSFALSGVCALTYQVAWARLFIGEFGATSGATATVLAAFMGGLALGSLFFGRVADRTRHPLRLYGLLECAVGAFALALPGLLDLAGPYLQDLLAPAAASAATAGLAAPHSVARALRFVVAFLLLLPPTVCMGGTFPVLAAAWGGGEGRGARWAFLYGTNTLGAALGALLSGFWWIGAWGVQGTVEAAAWMNVGVGLLAVGGAALVARGTGETTVAPPARRAPGENPTAPPARRGPGGSLYLLIGAAALLGFVGLSLEVVWHRILGVIVVNTSYSFSILLTVFLAALALGSAAASVAMHLGARPRSLLGTVVQLLGCGILLGMLLLRHPNTAPGTHLSSLGGELWNQYLSGIWLDAFLALFVPAFCLGMAFPLLCAEAAAARERSRGLAVGGITAANTVGAVAGSLLTGFVLIPWIGDFQSLLASLAVLATLLGLLLVREAGGWRRVRPAVVGLALLSVFALEYQHLPDSRALTVGNGMLGGKRGERMVCVDYREGASLTVGVLQSRDAEQRRVLYTNSFAMAGTGPDYAYMRMLAHLPMMSVPAAENACVIGFGTGTTAGTLSLYPLRSLDIVEIAPEVVEMAKWFERENHGIALRLAHAPDAHSSMAGGGSASEDGALASRADPTGAASIVEIVDRFPESPSDRREPAQPGTRLRLIVEDGAHFLRTTRQQYDVITAEPPLPALAGSANLYGTDFYRAALDRLTPGGVVCQWVPLHGLSPGDFKMLVRTFARSFPHASLWYFREAAVLLGGRRSWNFDPYWMTAAMSLDRIEADLREIDAADPYAILSSFVCADRSLLAFAGEGSVVSLDRPRCEYFERNSSLRSAHWHNLEALFAGAESVLPYVERPSELGARWTQQDVLARWEGSVESLRAGRRRWYEAQEKELSNDAKAALRARQEAVGLYERAVRMLPANLLARRLFAESAPTIGRGEQATAFLAGLRPKDVTRPSVMARMLDAVQTGDSTVRMKAIQEISYYRDPRLVACLAGFVTHEDTNVRLQAVCALESYRGCPGVVSAVAKGLGDGEWPVRQAAARVLGRLKEKSATESLIAALEDPELAVREAALKSLEALTGARDLLYDVRGDSTVRSAGLDRWKMWQRGRR